MREAMLVFKKDLRLEWRSKVGIGQVLPFSLLVVLLFAFALDPERGVLDRVTSGLFWVVVLFSSVLTIERSFSVEAADGIFDALRLSGMAPAAIYAGKVSALTVQLLAVEAVLRRWWPLSAAPEPAPAPPVPGPELAPNRPEA